MQVMDQIEGVNETELPWEGTLLTAANRKQLGIFRPTIMSLLSRDPAERPSMAQFCDTCNRVLAGSTSVHV